MDCRLDGLFFPVVVGTASSTTGADSGTCEQLEHERTCPCPPQDRMEPVPECM